MPWKKGIVKTPIPSEISAIADEIDSTLGPISSVLSVTSDLLEIIKIYANPATDPFVPIVEAIYNELVDFVNNFFGAGLYTLCVCPYNVHGNSAYDNFGIPLLYPQQAISAAIASLSDLGDSDRPQFSSTAEIAAIGFMATSTSVPDFLVLVKAFNTVFSFPEWKYTEKETEKRSKEVIRSYQPDWRSFRLSQVDMMNDLKEVILDTLGNLKGYMTIPDNNIGDLITILQAKIALMDETVQKLRAAIQIISKSVSGIYTFKMPSGVGGNARLVQALHDSYLENCKATSGYTIMTILVAGGPSMATIDSLIELMGL